MSIPNRIHAQWVNNSIAISKNSSIMAIYSLAEIFIITLAFLNLLMVNSFLSAICEVDSIEFKFSSLDSEVFGLSRHPPQNGPLAGVLRYVQ